MSKPPNSTARKRQAVIVIHGIGEQQPMTTLREFADSVLGAEQDSDGSAYNSKPDPFSQSFELRCLTTRGNVHPQTDFFEFYWAHLMPNAPWSGIFDWVWLMMHRRFKDVPLQFRSVWLVLWISLVLFIVFIIASVIHAISHPQDWTELPFKIPFVVAIIGLILQGVFLSYIGDAATYLSPHPKNIAARHAIRSAGVALLESIHKSNEYDRIVVVGHSLGSVIGYDMLNFAWHRYYQQHGHPDSPQREYLKKAEELAVALHGFRKKREKPPEDLHTQWMELVQKTREELRTNKHPWLVANFVTLGSPLAHADLLLAQSRKDLNRKIEQREMPISPPAVDNHGSFSFGINYKLPDGKDSTRTTFVPHHAAWAACVCWTNLYFPCSWFLKGDFVGGPLAPLFGPGVNDVPVSTKIGGGWLAHTHYWTRDKCDGCAIDAPVKNLKRALDLGIWFDDLE
jgi:hypothetical protein